MINTTFFIKTKIISVRLNPCLIAIWACLFVSCSKKKEIASYSAIIPQAALLDSTRHKNVYYFGDSITQGAGASGTSRRWSTLLANAYQFNEFNFGVSGTTLENEDPVNPSAAPNMMQRAQSDIPVKSNNDKWLFFAYGTNDCHLNLPNYTPENFTAQYGEVIKIALSKGWKPADIIIIGGYLTNPATWNMISVEAVFGNLTNKYQQFKNSAWVIADTFHCQYIDPTAYMAAHGNLNLLYPDGIHLNDAGDYAVAVYLAEAIH